MKSIRDGIFVGFCFFALTIQCVLAETSPLIWMIFPIVSFFFILGFFVIAFFCLFRRARETYLRRKREQRGFNPYLANSFVPSATGFNQPYVFSYYIPPTPSNQQVHPTPGYPSQRLSSLRAPTPSCFMQEYVPENSENPNDDTLPPKYDAFVNIDKNETF